MVDLDMEIFTDETESEIDDLNIEVLVEKDIFRFKIPVDNVTLAKIMNSTQNLGKYLTSFVLLQPGIIFTPYKLIKGITTAILHNQINLCRKRDTVL